MATHDEPPDVGIRGVIQDQRFLLLLDTLPFPAFIVSAAGPAHYNEAFIAYVGFRPGSNRANRTALHHPDEQEILEAARDAGTRADTDYVVEARLRRFDGHYRWHRIHNKPLFENGRRTAYLGTATDIHDSRMDNESLERRVLERTSELEEANRRLLSGEARYRDLYNRTPVALHSSDENACLIEVNGTWLELFGYDRGQVIGKSPSAFMTPASARQFRDMAWPQMLSSLGQVRIMDYQFVTNAGRIFEGRLAGRGVFDQAGRLIRTWAAIADVTAEKQANKALGQAQRLDAIGQLTAGIAHDFNNLLTAILANLELLARPGSSDVNRQQRLIMGARAAAERGAKLTGQLLAFSRQQRIAVEATDVNLIVEQMRLLLEGTIGEAIEVVVEAEPGLPLALADATQLELAVLNLAINARDALGTGGRITITTAVATVGASLRPEEPEAGQYVVVEVRDNGPGIDEIVRERMFEPFFTTKDAGRGSGLGLAQVLGIMKQLGGGISVRSAPNEGTGMRLLMPVAKDQVARPATPPLGSNNPKEFRRSLILLVDDDPDVRSAASAILQEAGHGVVEAESGMAAWDALLQADGEFDLIIADVLMPGMSGPELASKAQSRWPALRVLFMTGYADVGQFSATIWNEVLSKPFSPSELEARVARAVLSTVCSSL